MLALGSRHLTGSENAIEIAEMLSQAVSDVCFASFKQPTATHERSHLVTHSTVIEFQERCNQILETARSLHATKPDWVTFFRETLGVDGAARSIFAIPDEYLQFEKSKEYEMIQQMVASLRNRKVKKGREEETKVITVRLPESLHEALKAEAAEHRTSMNKLCISKLLQALIDEEAEAQAAPISNSRMEPTANNNPEDNTPGFRSTHQY